MYTDILSLTICTAWPKLLHNAFPDYFSETEHRIRAQDLTEVNVLLKNMSNKID